MDVQYSWVVIYEGANPLWLSRGGDFSNNFVQDYEFSPFTRTLYIYKGASRQIERLLLSAWFMIHLSTPRQALKATSIFIYAYT